MDLQFACLCPLIYRKRDFANYTDLLATILRNADIYIYLSV